MIWKSQVSGLQTNKRYSADLSDQFCFRSAKKLKWKPCWNEGKSKGIVFQSGSSTSYGHESQNKHNKTISPDLVCSTSAPLDFLPGKLLNWLQRKLNIEARIPQQASSKFMFLHSAVHLCFLVLVFFLLDIFLTHFWRKLHL